MTFPLCYVILKTGRGSPSRSRRSAGLRRGTTPMTKNGMPRRSNVPSDYGVGFDFKRGGDTHDKKRNGDR